MAGLFDEQARQYAAARPTYPASLFSFLASLTPRHVRAWDVGTGSGQAAVALSELYEEVIATDVSENQLGFAAGRPNIRYALTPARMSPDDLRRTVGEEGTVDLVTVAQALHWFDLDLFYGHVTRVLRKPGGVVAAWCYTEPSVGHPPVDAIFERFYADSGPHWEAARAIVDDEFRSLPFPFKPLDVADDRGRRPSTGPIRFEAQKEATLEEYLTYLKSMSVLQCARRNGVELLDEARERAFREAWGPPDQTRCITWPIFLRVGTV